MRAIAVLLIALALTSAAVAKPVGTKDLGCSICTFVVNFAEEVLQNNATEQEIEDALAPVCGLLGAFQQECDDFLATELPALIQLLLESENPQTICTQLGACSSRFQRQRKPMHINAIKAVPQPQDGTLCSICTVIISSAESWLASNATETEIINWADNICDQLPGGIGPICTGFVEQYLPLAINWLINNENPSVFCSQIGLCSSKMANGAKPLLPKLPSGGNAAMGVQVINTPKPKDGTLCSICTLAIASIETYISNNQTEAQIIAYLENICNQLGGGIAGICNAFVDQYVPQAIQWIINNEPPSVFCSQIGLCSSSAQPQRVRAAKLSRPHVLPMQRISRA